MASLYGCWYCPITLCLPCFFGQRNNPKHASVCTREGEPEASAPGGATCANCGRTKDRG